MDELILARIRAVLDALQKGPTSLSPRPKRVVTVAPGTNVPDDECCSGQLSGRLVSLTPKIGRPQASGAVGRCSVSWWDATVEVKIVRCAHVVDENGKAPTPAEMNGDGLQVLRDMQAITSTILGLDTTTGIGQWTPTGPLGGCTGGTITFTTRV